MFQEFVDLEVFQEAKKVVDALKNQEVGPALAWCAENKSRLKKSKVCTHCVFWIIMIFEFHSMMF